MDTGDLIGVTVVDGSNGLPIGWQLISGSGDRLYAYTEYKSAQELPMTGQFYTNYAYINNHNQFAIAAFVSNSKSHYMGWVVGG